MAPETKTLVSGCFAEVRSGLASLNISARGVIFGPVPVPVFCNISCAFATRGQVTPNHTASEDILEGHKKLLPLERSLWGYEQATAYREFARICASHTKVRHEEGKIEESGIRLDSTIGSLAIRCSVSSLRFVSGRNGNPLCLAEFHHAVSTENGSDWLDERYDRGSREDPGANLNITGTSISFHFPGFPRH
jgi:hypothetical protein